ncbi:MULTISPECIES: hypothetical protein [Nocardiaceae]|uniref:Glyoxalase superfamily protein PhnB n=1 Tax=Rhodococcoides corynebacterioides TaxID=53972 RepID=A0ABS2KY53_9NOCA|nr:MULTISPECIES: hypothetical protein [Rhodococcus]MBM7416860.1 putative glyoxalase superfamily protein PhnB [Rhodococcus corynebacterioides]MBP1115113.1 putative glyoxalase superfamily protein PhnB [Rhodococcus sp. PvP016]
MLDGLVRLGEERPRHFGRQAGTLTDRFGVVWTIDVMAPYGG